MSVSEDETVGATLLRLTATDADFTHDNTELEFNIISSRTRRTGDDDEDDDEVEEEEDGRGWFTVTESTGELILVSALDRETTDRYELTVTASDRGQPSLTTTTTVSIPSHFFNSHNYLLLIRSLILVIIHRQSGV